MNGIGHHFAFEDAGLRIKELDDGRASIASGFYDDFRIAVDDFPFLDIRQLCSNEANCHPPPKHTHTRLLDIYIERGVAPSGRWRERASGKGGEQSRQAGEDEKPKLH